MMRVALALLAVLLLSIGASRPMVSCPEDAVPVGFGDYSGGYWASYECVAIDDIAAGALR